MVFFGGGFFCCDGRNGSYVSINYYKYACIIMQELERRIKSSGYERIYLKTASVLKEACNLYLSEGYKQVLGEKTAECDKIMYKEL